MTYSIQGNDITTCPVLTPSMYITCRACNTAYWISGEEIPTESYTSHIGFDDIESSMDQTLDKLGWVDCICPYCIDLNRDIVKIYNQADQHEDEQ